MSRNQNLAAPSCNDDANASRAAAFGSVAFGPVELGSVAFGPTQLGSTELGSEGQNVSPRLIPIIPSLGLIRGLLLIGESGGV